MMKAIKAKSDIMHESRDPEDFIWRPFTQHQTEPAPIHIARAEQEFLFGADGKEYLDCISSWWTITHGHQRPEINAAIIKQLSHFSHIMFAGFTHEPAQALAQGLISVTEGAFDKVFFSDNGSSAVEAALKMAYQYHRNRGNQKRNLFLAFEGGYHGDTFGAMAAGRGSRFFHPFEDLLAETRLAPFPAIVDEDTPAEIHAKETAALSRLREILAKEGERIVAFIGEPLLQGAGGMRMARPAFFRELCKILRDAGVLIIFDEVATGFGRTGSLFAFQQIGIAPDFLCLSKGLTGGYAPLSVTMTHAEIFSAFKSDDFSKAFPHGHSFTGHAPACAAAVASLRLFETDNSFAKIAGLNRFYQDWFAELKKRGDVRNFRSLGSVAAFELPPAEQAQSYKSGRSERFRAECLQAGLNLRPLGDTIYVLPPYCFRPASQARLQETVGKILDKIL